MSEIEIIFDNLRIGAQYGLLVGIVIFIASWGLGFALNLIKECFK